MKRFIRNMKENLLAGIVIVGISLIIYLLTGCEQPELQQHESNRIDSIQTVTKDSIESWDNDTTVYHSDSKPS